MKILITGSVGTGKSSLSILLGKQLNLPVFHLSDIIVEQKLYKNHDAVFDSAIPDEDALMNYFRTEILPNNTSMIIDHHSFDIFSREFLDVTIVLHTDLKIMRQRLEQRDYPEVKI